MGECSDKLDAIDQKLGEGIKIKDDDGNVITPLKEENGNVEDIKQSLDKFQFDSESGKLLVSTVIGAGDLQIGAAELKDSSTETRANIETDDGKGALYVQSKSLLTSSAFDSGVGLITSSVDALGESLDSIKTQTDKLNFTESGNLMVDTGVSDPATDTSVQAVTSGVADLLIKNDFIVEESVSFAENDSSGLVKILKGSALGNPLEGLRAVYGIGIENPSATVDVTVQFYLKETFSGDTRYMKLGESFVVESGDDDMNPDQVDKVNVAYKQVRGAYLAEGLAIAIKNNDSVPGGAGFDVRIKIRKAD